MKKILLLLTIICFTFIPKLQAYRLEVGKKVPGWFFPADEKEYSLDSWPGRIVIINYVDLRFHEQGNEVAEALKNAVLEGKLSLKLYQPVALINCDKTWHPDFIIRYSTKKAIAKLTVLKPLLLFDYDGILDKRSIIRNKKDASCFIVIDKKGICRAIYRGKLSASQIEEMISLAMILQNESDGSLKGWIDKIWPE